MIRRPAATTPYPFTYVPPACGLQNVIETVSAWPDFFGWKCAACRGPVRLTDYAARLMTGHPDETGRPGDPLFVHDIMSDFYWRPKVASELGA